MIPRLIELATWAAAIWLIRRDTAQRPGISPALWIPTLWIGILLSRPMSAWLGWGGGAGGAESMEGSPVDALFYFLLIIAAALVLNKRQVNWCEIISDKLASVLVLRLPSGHCSLGRVAYCIIQALVQRFWKYTSGSCHSHRGEPAASASSRHLALCLHIHPALGGLYSLLS